MKERRLLTRPEDLALVYWNRGTVIRDLNLQRTSIGQRIRDIYNWRWMVIVLYGILR